MAITFPASPTTGQVFTSGGVSWTWDGVKWTGASGWSDAPADNNTYGRMNGSWNSVNALIAAGVAPAENNFGRNLIHNPVFSVQQRGAGPFTAQGYTLDRWYNNFSTTGGSCSVTSAAMTLPNGLNDEAIKTGLSYQNTAGTGAGDYSLFTQFIEDVRRLAGKTVTLSFNAWAASGTPRIGIELQQNFGTGGSPSTGVSGIGSQAITIGTTSQRYSVTVTLPSAAGKTLGTNNNDYTNVGFWFNAGANYAARASNIGFQSNTFYITGIQLEIGNQATPLDRGGSPQQVLAECQRFYFVGQATSGGYYSGTVTVATSVLFPVAMRATPTIVTTSNADGGGLTSPASTPIAGGVQFSANTSGGPAGYSINRTFTASADL